MKTTTLYIKNMVCPRCIKTVEEEIKKIGFKVKHIELGKVEVREQIGTETIKKIDKVLTENGFELIYDKKNQIIDKIKTIIIGIIHHDREIPNNVNISDFLARELGYDYSYLSNLFSSLEETTIEKYILQQKTEKIKELLTYDELNLTEISYQLGYSSVQHLSNQFKKNTGLSPSQYKKQKENKRNPLDKV